MSPTQSTPGNTKTPTTLTPTKNGPPSKYGSKPKAKLIFFCAGLGTTGTLIGNARFLKAKNLALKIVGAIRAPDNYVPGVRTEDLLKVVDFDWRCHVNHMEFVQTKASYISSMSLSRNGILAGGQALVGLLNHLKDLKKNNQLDAMRRSVDDEITCVFPCPDGPMPYLDEYFKYIDASHFPSIKNEEILVNKP